MLAQQPPQSILPLLSTRVLGVQHALGLEGGGWCVCERG